ncbi:hypothetical protein Tco_0845896 [Tanacetum coccineum]
MVVQAQEEMGEGSAMPTDPYHTPTIIQPSISQPQKKQKPRKPKRKDTEVPQPSGPINNVTNEAVYKEMDDSLEKADTTATGLDAEQDKGNINKTQSKATLNEPSSIGTSSGSGHRRQETMGDTIALTRSENVSKHSNDPLLARGGCIQTGEKIDDIDKDADITLIDETQGRYGDDLIFDTVSTADPVTTASKVVTTASPTETTAANDLTLAQTLIETRSAKSKVKGVVIGDKSESTTRTRPQQLPLKDKDELEEEDMLVRQREEEANIVSLDNVQAMIDADYQMDQQMQAEEQEKLRIEEKSKFEVRAEGSETRAEGSSKRAGEELEQESSKKKKLEEDKESKELKQCLEIVPNDGDDVTIDATPLSTKSPTIVDYKIHKEGKKSFFKLSEQMKTEPVNYMDNFLLLNLKTMFEHHVEDNVWKNQQGLVKVLNWKLYDSCGVHCITIQSMLFNLLVEKMYPLTKHTLHQMFNDVKLQVDYVFKMAFELLRLVKK